MIAAAVIKPAATIPPQAAHADQMSGGHPSGTSATPSMDPAPSTMVRTAARAIPDKTTSNATTTVRTRRAMNQEVAHRHRTATLTSGGHPSGTSATPSMDPAPSTMVQTAARVIPDKTTSSVTTTVRTRRAMNQEVAHRHRTATLTSGGRPSGTSATPSTGHAPSTTVQTAARVIPDKTISSVTTTVRTRHATRQEDRPDQAVASIIPCQQLIMMLAFLAICKGHIIEIEPEGFVEGIVASF